MYIKLYAIPCPNRDGDYLDGFWRFVKNTGQTKGQDWVELTGLSSTNENDMTMLRRILSDKKKALLETGWHRGYQSMHDCAVNRAMRRAERFMQWENGLSRTSF